MNRVLPCWFYRIHDGRVRVDPNDWTAGHVAGPPLDLSRIRANDCLAGHWAVPGEYLHERYPEILTERKYRLFTFVRDPLEIKLSLYFWEKRKGKDFGTQSIEDELLTRPNFMANRFPCAAEDVDRVLSRYFFIGVTERMQESFDRLANLVGRPRIRLPRANRSRTARDRVELDREFIREFRIQNHVDYLIYDYCRERLEAPDA